jgi:DHA3 family tetracycline resistance protein-like MFS transporter
MHQNRALTIYLIYSAALAALTGMIFTVSSIYQVTVAHLDPLQLVLVGTMLEAAVFIFEVPTGVVADSYSRRLSVIIGVFLIGAGFLIEGTWPLFSVILLGQLFWGIGWTFTSGATQAWISDEIGEERAGTAFLKAAQIGPIAGVVGLLAGMGFGMLRVNLPIQLGGALFMVLGIFLLLTMPEDGFSPTPSQNRTTWAKLWHTFQGGVGMVRKRPALGGILGVGLFYGLYSEGFDRLWTAHLISRFSFPPEQLVLWFGAIRGVGMLLSAAAAHAVEHRVDISSTIALARAILIISLGLVVGLVLFGSAGSLPLALIVFWLIGVMRSLQEPLYMAWVNHRLDSQVRATVISMSNLVDAMGQIAGGPLVGVIARLVSVPAGLFSSAALLAPVALLLSGQTRKEEGILPVETAE